MSADPRVRTCSCRAACLLLSFTVCARAVHLSALRPNASEADARRAAPEADADDAAPFDLLGDRTPPSIPAQPIPDWVPWHLRSRYQEVFEKLDAYFNVVERKLKSVDYTRVPRCTDSFSTGTSGRRPYINSVIHIKSNRWTEVCGDLSQDSVRGRELIRILDKIVPGLDPEIDIHIPFGLHDGVHNVHEDNQGQPVFGVMYHSAFSPITIPFAMGCTRTDSEVKAFMNSPVVGWDSFVREHYTCSNDRAYVNKAAFRGKAGKRHSKYGACCGTLCQVACDSMDNGRLYAHVMGEEHPEILDTEVSNVDQFDVPVAPMRHKRYLPYPEQLCNYKAVLTIGSNADWAERLRQSFYGNAIVMVPRRAPHEFFTSFMKPFKHYWPINPDLSDMVEQVRAVTKLADTSSHIRDQRQFAADYLTEEFMLFYNKVAIEQFYRRADSYRMALLDPEAGGNVRHDRRMKYSEWLLGLEGCPEIQLRCESSWTNGESLLAEHERRAAWFRDPEQ